MKMLASQLPGRVASDAMKAASGRVRRNPTSFVAGRRGGLSVVDALAAAIAAAPGKRLTIPELIAAVSGALGYPVPSSSVRSALYTKVTIFKRVQPPDGKVAYALSDWALKQL